VQAVGGELGVARTVEMLRDELKTCMQLGGTQHVGQIDRTFIVRHGVAEDEVSPFLACIGSPCIRHCVHGASIGPGPGGGLDRRQGLDRRRGAGSAGERQA
jgi:hypothetical protein